VRIRKSDYAALAKVLRDARLSSGLTQLELAARLGVPQSFVSKYESGERRLDVLELRQVACALNCSVADLLLKTEATLEGSK
jgi:transcriptional regulator with XRE-family HTH domain